jgi:hypothetical protein
MIYESAPWKRGLARDATTIEQWAKRLKVTERRSILIEQKIFLAAYSMRKLAQAGKLSSMFDGLTLRCRTSPLLEGRKIDKYNAHRFAELYDFDKSLWKTISALALLDMLIHSFLFSEVIEENKAVTGFFVTSDRHLSNIWLIEIDSFIKLMRQVSLDYPSEIHWVRNSETGEYIEWRGREPPPPQIRSKMDRLLKEGVAQARARRS